MSAAGPLTLLCGAGNFGKIWSACRQHEIQYTERKMCKDTHDLTCLFFYISYTIVVYGADNNRKKEKNDCIGQVKIY
jgi:hypothetical protein